MRLDIFLKKSRLIKRRPVAKQMCDQGAVQVNGAVAKPGTRMAVGDLLLIANARRLVEVRILELPSGNVPRARAAQLYDVLRNERCEVDILDWFDDEDDDFEGGFHGT